MTPFRTSLFCAALLAAIPVGLSAQETTTTPHTATRALTIDSAQVVYVSGDDAVVKTPDGHLRFLEIAPGTPLVIDGKESKPSDLTPGSTISHVQLHTRVDSEVKTVEQISGTIRDKKGPFLTLRLDDGTSKIFRVPPDATFNVNGQETNYNSVTRGMKIDVTVVTTEGKNSHHTKSAMMVNTPPQQGTLVEQSQ